MPGSLEEDTQVQMKNYRARRQEKTTKKACVLSDRLNSLVLIYSGSTIKLPSRI